ncbi:MAG: hypothetical protein Q4A69_08400 [Moraxella sp.]|nr:hypothetical protein [Moraxella sp.]
MPKKAKKWLMLTLVSVRLIQTQVQMHLVYVYQERNRMVKFKLIKAFRTTENEVCVMYRDLERQQDFVVYWNNIHPSTGEIVDYDLQLDCLSNSEDFNEKVINAIKDGEDGEDGDLYITLRDTFDAQDCDSLE